MNIYVLGMVASIFLGVSMVPWNITMKVVKPGHFFMVLGAVFFISGAVQSRTQAQPGKYTAAAAVVALLAAVTYVSGMTVLNYTFPRTPPEALGSIGAILAAFVVPTLITNSVVYKSMPSTIELILAAIVVAGCAGLSLVGKH